MAERNLGVAVRKTVTLYYRGETVSGSAIENLFTSPANAFWGLQSDGSFRDGEQVSDNWFAVIQTGSRDAALGAYKLALPTTVNLQLPDLLRGVSTVWNSASSAGSFDSTWSGFSAWVGQPSGSLSGSEQASAEGAASIQPELSLDIVQYSGRDIPATGYFFYLKLIGGAVAPEDFQSKVEAVSGHTVQWWPTFNPVAHSVVLKGGKAAVSAKASASASLSGRISPGADTTEVINKDKNSGVGGSYDVATSMTVVRIPPTIDGTIAITDSAPQTATAQASCDVGWPEGTVLPEGTEIAGHPFTILEATASTGTLTKAVSGSVSPTTLTATNPSEIPSTGFYIINTRISPYEDGWAQCYAEVFEAAHINPIPIPPLP